MAEKFGYFPKSAEELSGKMVERLKRENAGRESMKFRQSLFWDVESKKIDHKKNANYVIERILEFGKDKEVSWLYQTYKPALLKKTINKSRSLSPKTRNLWNLILKKK